MSFEMKPEIKAALEKINFIDKYQKLSDRFKVNPNDLYDRLEDYDLEKVMAIFASLGYKALFDKKEKFLQCLCMKSLKRS